jgi:hypothetical protein
MDKKDIYEHLAKIYLDASSQKKKKHKEFPALFKCLFFASTAAVFIACGVLFLQFGRHNRMNSQIALVLAPDVVKINFHFDPAKSEIYSVPLNKLDLSWYKSLAFAVKKANPRDNISLRVEFASAYKEKSFTYLKDIPHNWKEYTLNFADFPGISDWSNMSGLSFIVEEYNAREKKGVVYVDNVRFLK